jgi:hypothetical protein
MRVLLPVGGTEALTSGHLFVRRQERLDELFFVRKKKSYACLSLQYADTYVVVCESYASTYVAVCECDDRTRSASGVCTSKASKLGTRSSVSYSPQKRARSTACRRCQYLYFCTSKASKLRSG